MKQKKYSNTLALVGTKKVSNGIKQIVYSIRLGANTYYAFTRNYSEKTYNMVKSGIRVNDLLYKKSRDTAVMNLINCSKRLVPYLVDFYELNPA